MATPAWSGHGEFEPAIINAVDGGQYTRLGAGLYIDNHNTAAPGGNSGTRGIYAYGQSLGNVPSRVDIAGYVPLTITASNVFNPTSNEGVYASAGAQIHFGGRLNVTTNTSNVAYRARAVVADGTGVGALATLPSRVTVDGALQADTTNAAQTPFAVEAIDGGQIAVHGGGALQSAQSGLYVRATGAGAVYSGFSSFGATLLTVQAAGNGVTLEGASGNANAGAVHLDNAVITAHDSGVRLHSANAVSSDLLYQQNAGSITSTDGSAIVFTGGVGKTNVELVNTAVTTNSPVMGGQDPNGAPIGYAVVSVSAANNRLHMNGGSITGSVATDAGAKLWLDVVGTVWDTAGDPASVGVNSMTGMTGSLTIQMPDIRDRIELVGDTPGLGIGCGNADVILVIPTAQAAPAASPHTVMLCKNDALAPVVALQGGSVVLGGFVYTLQTTAAGGRVIYDLVRGAAAPAAPPGAGVTSVPTLSQWGVVALTALLGIAAWRRRRG